MDLLAEYYIRRGLYEKARDLFEEGMYTVITVRDFSVIFDSYTQFEERMLAYKMEDMDEDGAKENEDEDEDNCFNYENFEENILHGFWLNDRKDIDLRLAHFDYLMERRPELANSVLFAEKSS